jgi:hypothetical protein
MRCKRPLALLMPLFLMGWMAALSPTLLPAQISKATISGAIRDSRGGALPHVKIVATEVATHTVTTAESNDAGEYILLC